MSSERGPGTPTPKTGRFRRPLLKVILLGDPGVGKTALITRFVDDHFVTVYKATIGADFHSKEIVVDEQTCILQVWDTAGQERFQSLGSTFFRGSDCCCLVFDVNVQRSFENLDHWHSSFISQCEPENPETFPFVLIGNKTDLTEQRLITVKTAEEWCTSKGDIPFIETSAKEATNVREAFECVARRALKCQDSESELLYPTLTPVNLEDTEIILHSPQHSHQPSVSIDTSSPEASHSTNSDCC